MAESNDIRLSVDVYMLALPSPGGSLGVGTDGYVLISKTENGEDVAANVTIEQVETMLSWLHVLRRKLSETNGGDHGR